VVISPVVMPRVVVAAPASGHGKTSITTGLLAALRARGLVVSGHKIGPDYIDPGYHAIAAGRVGRNLDPWLVGEHRIAPLFLHGALTPAPAAIAVVEGVMGLFDGAAGRGELASTAQVARLLDAPVLLVVDATAIGRSVAALVHGFAGYDRRLRLGGVILNRVGSDRHEQILREAIGELGIPVLGAIRRRDELVTPSRHLGLIPAAERAPQAAETVAALGEVVGSGVDLDAVVRLAGTAPPLRVRPWDPGGPDDVRGPAPVVAVAAGPAFTFGYAETTELLEAAGATVAGFDPLHDERLPAGTAGIVIGGGFPEVHAAALSANTGLRAEVAAAAAAGVPIAAECAGLLYLARSLDGAPMCGVLPADATMTGRLTLGYREATAEGRSCLAEQGTTVRGHEFHRTACTPPHGDPAAWLVDRDAGDEPEGFVTGAVHASYLHLHWAGRPRFATRFTAACRTPAGLPR
jgi:cobyrinic acid a,c-diamide synthase